MIKIFDNISFEYKNNSPGNEQYVFGIEPDGNDSVIYMSTSDIFLGISNVSIDDLIDIKNALENYIIKFR